MKKILPHELTVHQGGEGQTLAERHSAPPMQMSLPIAFPRTVGKNGAVYTKPWVVELVLELAGYRAERNLVDALAIEPASGDGAFVVPMVRRLLASCRRQRRPIHDCAGSLTAYELTDSSARAIHAAVMKLLADEGVSAQDTEQLAAGWIRTGDYLLDAPALLAADYVIGNPPYVRLEEIGEYVAAQYRAAYPTMKGRADIYVAFFEAALRQLAPGGTCAFICADRWMLNQYGAELRRLITTGYSVETVVEMHGADAFADEVSAYPAITVIRRAGQGSTVIASADASVAASDGDMVAGAIESVRRRASEAASPQGLTAVRVDTWFKGAEPWPFTSPHRLSLLKRLEQDFMPLESEDTGTKVGIGVATGADDVYITTNAMLVEPSRLLPLAMASDTVGGALRWSGHYLVNPWDADGIVDLARFPRLGDYLRMHQTRLQQRHVGKKNHAHWYRTIDRVNQDLAPKPKLYVPDIKDKINPVLDVGQTYPHHNLYVITSEAWDLEVLGGLLLSDVGQFFIECYAVRMRGGYLRFQAQYLRRIRVPAPTSLTEQQVDALKSAFRRRDRALATLVAHDIYHIEAMPIEVKRGC